MPPGSNGSAVVFFVRRYQLRRQERFPLPMKFMKHDGGYGQAGILSRHKALICDVVLTIFLRFLPYRSKNHLGNRYSRLIRRIP